MSAMRNRERNLVIGWFTLLTCGIYLLLVECLCSVR